MFDLHVRRGQLSVWLAVGLAATVHARAQTGNVAPLKSAVPAWSVPSTSEIDLRIVSVLDGANSYGWDKTNRGIFINWRRDDPKQVQCNDHRCDTSDIPTRHDPINDVRLLQHMYWYKYRHPGDHHFDAAIARILPTVKQRWGRSHLEKGWVYYVLLRLSLYADDPAERAYWEEAAKGWVAAQVKHIDPAVGVQHDKNLGNCDCGAHTIRLGDAYRVDHAVESGAALIDAGSRFAHPDWVQAGYGEVMTAYKETFSEKYHLFARIYLFEDPKYGKDKVWDAQARMGETSEEADALLRAGQVVQDLAMRKNLYAIAGEILTALRTSTLHDREHGGFFDSIFTADNFDGRQAGTLSGTDKESRQLSLVGTYHLADQLLTPKNQFADMETEMLRVVYARNDDPQYPGMYLPDTGKFPGMVNGYAANISGYTYHLNADFSIYQGKAPGGENWVSNEANSLALLGLQEYLTPIDH